MYWRHSIKHLVRTWGKSLLFGFLILLLTTVLCIGFGMVVTVKDFAAQSHDRYTTIGVLEYMSASYPDESTYDPGIEDARAKLDLAQLARDPRVLGIDVPFTALGSVEGFTRSDSLSPYRNGTVLVVRIDSYVPDYGVYQAIIARSLYPLNGGRQDTAVYINSMGLQLTPGRYYLVHGSYYYGITSYSYIMLEAFQGAAAARAGFSPTLDQMAVDVTTEDGGFAVAEDAPLYDLARTYAVVNNGVSVAATRDANAHYLFQQEMLFPVEGRAFTPEEYTQGSRVCMLSKSIADQCGYQLGDEIELSVAAAGQCALYESYWAGSGFAFRDRYTIVGILNNQEELPPYVFIPQSDTTVPAMSAFTYTLAHIRLDNDLAPSFYDDMQAVLPREIRLTIYDQGYAGVMQPLRDILRIATVLTAVFVLAGISLFALFGYLFVYRQRATADIMLRLGAGRRNIVVYFLYGASAIAVCAAALGAFAGRAAALRLDGVLQTLTERASPYHYAFSNGNLSIQKAAPSMAPAGVDVYAAVFACVVAAALVSCSVFLWLSLRRRVPKARRVRGANEAKRSRSLKGGAFRYALLSILRGRLRSLLPVAVAACAVVLLCQISATSLSYQQKLDALCESTDIRGRFTDIRCRQTDHLVLDAALVRDLWSSGYLSQLSMTSELPYRYMGRSAINGVPQEVAMPDFSNSSFAFETFLNSVLSGPGLVFTNTLRDVPAFTYSDWSASYLDGYDEGMLAEEADGVAKCMMPETLMEKQGVALGDTIQVAIIIQHNSQYGFSQQLQFVDMLVVGSYRNPGAGDSIYCQLSGMISPALLLGETPDQGGALEYATLQSVSFTLKDAVKLIDWKEHLVQSGYSEATRVRAIRSFIVLDDYMFLRTADALTQRIQYASYLSPVLYAAIGLLAFVIPFLLVQGRRRELIVMRGMGTSRLASFLSLFVEQLALCTLGVAFALASWGLLMRHSGTTEVILAASFLLCWLAGTAVSLLRSSRRGALSRLNTHDS